MLFERKDNNNFPNTKIKNHDISEQAHPTRSQSSTAAMALSRA
jgi:hypothetical protein